MAYSRRRPDINIEPDILENGESYDFFQAVKLLKKISGSPSTNGTRLSNIRIQPELNLDYPQSDIAEIKKLEGDNQYQITTTFFGLCIISTARVLYRRVTWWRVGRTRKQEKLSRCHS